MYDFITQEELEYLPIEDIYLVSGERVYVR